MSVQNKIKQNLGTTIPLSTFLARATDLANDELPRGAGEKKSQDELFEEILGASELKTSRGEYVPDLNAVEIEGAERQAPKEEEGDIIDFLSGKKSARKTVKGEEIPVGSAANVFSLTVPMSEEKRAKVFLERIKTLLQVEPGRLVL